MYSTCSMSWGALHNGPPGNSSCFSSLVEMAATQTVDAFATIPFDEARSMTSPELLPYETDASASSPDCKVTTRPIVHALGIQLLQFASHHQLQFLRGHLLGTG